MQWCQCMQWVKTKFFFLPSVCRQIVTDFTRISADNSPKYRKIGSHAPPALYPIRAGAKKDYCIQLEAARLYPFQSQTVLAYQPHSILNVSDFVESETSNAFYLRSPKIYLQTLMITYFEQWLWGPYCEYQLIKKFFGFCWHYIYIIHEFYINLFRNISSSKVANRYVLKTPQGTKAACGLCYLIML